MATIEASKTSPHSQELDCSCLARAAKNYNSAIREASPCIGRSKHDSLAYGRIDKREPHGDTLAAKCKSMATDLVSAVDDYQSFNFSSINCNKDTTMADDAAAQQLAERKAMLAHVNSLIQVARKEIQSHILSTKIILHTHASSILLRRLYGGEPDSKQRQCCDDAWAFSQAVSCSDIAQDETVGEPEDARYSSLPSVVTSLGVEVLRQ